MPRGPQGQTRPAGVTQCAVHVARIAIGEIEDTRYKNQAQAEGASKGGHKRASKLTPERRSEIAKAAAEARWSGRKHGDQMG